MTIDGYLESYAAHLRDLGAIRSNKIEAAFRSVRRDRCVTQFYVSPTECVHVPQDTLPPSSVLEQVYSDSALVTRMPDPDFSALSSSSLPSLMAQMLEALDLRPGHRALEVGAGTGYNASLIAFVTGEPVVSVDVQPKVVADAEAAVQRLGVDHVTVLCRDGYDGYEAGAPYDRMIVTVACTGVSPEWTDQLDDEGLILAPIAHGGAHPVMAIRSDGEGVTGQPVLWTDFMRARGPLYEWTDIDRPLVFEPLTNIDATERVGVIPALSPAEYTDLQFFMAIYDNRITEATAPDVNDDPATGRCALIDPDLGTAFIKIESVALAGDPSLLDDIQSLYEGWDAVGRPRLSDWRCKFTMAGTQAAPLLVPAQWWREEADTAAVSMPDL